MNSENHDVNEMPRSPYRMGNWTVTMLKEELKNRKLTLSGKKAELIDRLEGDDSQKGKSPIRQQPENPSSVTSSSPVKQGGSSPRRFSGLTLTSDEEQLLRKLTVSQLQQELRNRGLSPYGRKDELVARLAGEGVTSGTIVTSVLDKTPLSNKQQQLLQQRLASSPTKSPTPKGTEKPLEGSPKKPAVLLSRRKSISAPLPWYGVPGEFAAALFKQLNQGISAIYNNHGIACLVAAAFFMIVATMVLLEGPHQQYLKPVKVLAFWYGRWFLLGVLSSIGVGLGTFFLFLGPFIARVASAAGVCRNVDFEVFGPRAFACQSKGAGLGKLAVITVLNKVKWEAFLWGLGTAVGYLPGFLLARAAAERGVEGKTGKCLGSMVKCFGFIGCLYLAAVPNPLFDLAVLAFGFSLMSVEHFWSATVIGKAALKPTLQALFVILLFTKESFGQVLSKLRETLPASIYTVVESFLQNQRKLYQEPISAPKLEYFMIGWRLFVFAAVILTAASVIKAIAVSHKTKQE